MRLPMCLVVVFVLTSSARADTPKKVDFAHDIIPLLKTRCAECHTIDAKGRPSPLTDGRFHDTGIAAKSSAALRALSRADVVIFHQTAVPYGGANNASGSPIFGATSPDRSSIATAAISFSGVT